MKKSIFYGSIFCVIILSSCIPDDYYHADDYYSCDSQDTGFVKLIGGRLDVPCNIQDCYNEGLTLPTIFPTNSIYELMSNSFWELWESSFSWETELLGGKYCSNDEKQTLLLSFDNSNYSYYINNNDEIETVPSYRYPSEIQPYDCKHTMVVQYFSDHEETCITWTKTWPPGTGYANENFEEYWICESVDPFVGQIITRNSLHRVYINNQFEDIYLY